VKSLRCVARPLPGDPLKLPVICHLRFLALPVHIIKDAHLWARMPGNRPEVRDATFKPGSLKEMMSVGKIAVHEFVTLDGVIEDPSWSFDYSFDSKMGEAIGEIMSSSEALLLGRRTFQEFAPSWSTRTAEDDPGAPFMNEARKYVVSGTLQTADWNNSTIIGPYNPDTIRDLKERIDGSIYVSGSGTLVRAMLADGLVDELHLFVYPLAHGAGQRLFSDGGPKIKLTLAGSQAYSNGVLHLTYRPVRSGLE